MVRAATLSTIPPIDSRTARAGRWWFIGGSSWESQAKKRAGSPKATGWGRGELVVSRWADAAGQAQNLGDAVSGRVERGFPHTLRIKLAGHADELPGLVRARNRNAIDAATDLIFAHLD